MKYYWRITGLLFLIACITVNTRAQETNNGGDYELIPSPDLWYNSVDGLRVGGRLKGDVPGTFGSGPHRLNLGVWLATKFPSDPVSYYFSFTERLKAISDYDSEGNIELVSSIRTGYDLHGIAFNKKWQPGFDENIYQALRAFLSFRKHYDDRYLLYPSLWDRDWMSLLSLSYQFHDRDGAGPYMFDINLNTGLPLAGSFFEQFSGEFQQKLNIGAGFSLDSRLFATLSSLKTPVQMLYLRSQAPAQDWMDNGFTRARGTLPPYWFNEGLIQKEGGADLRGYSRDDFKRLSNGMPLLYNNFLATSQELEYPNPVENFVSRAPVIGDIIKMRSYLFGDFGTGRLAKGFRSDTSWGTGNWMADAGAGFSFSVSIPDNLGNMRKLGIRYDIPIWISDVAPGNPHWKYRSLIGFSAIFDL